MSPDPSDALFTVSIINLEGDGEVDAQYNPKEIGIDKSVTWSPAQHAKGNAPALEFTAGTGRSLSLELTFDGFEDGTDVHAEYVDPLVQMCMVSNPDGSSDDQKRPPKVKLVWGVSKLPDFVGVIESVSTKYTMFKSDGTPVRATCSVKLKEASSVSFKKGQ